jgi:hypothetical protein
MVPKRDSKLLKALQKIVRSRCTDLGKNNLCSIIGRVLTFLLIIKMGRDLKNKTMAKKYVFSKISRNSVGNVQERIYSYIRLYGRNTCNLKQCQAFSIDEDRWKWEP